MYSALPSNCYSFTLESANWGQGLSEGGVDDAISAPTAAAAGPREAPEEASTEEARAWLEGWGILPERELPADQLRRRHLALSSVKFGSDVSLEQKRRFLQDMLAHEQQIAAHQSDIGYVRDPKYHYKLQLESLAPIRQAPIKLQPEQEEWVSQYLKDLEDKGVITRILPHEETPLVTAIFLVPNGQSGQPYRLVQNIVPVNKRTTEYQHVMTEARRVKEGLRRYKYASMLDLKAGYFNVPFDDKSSYLSTFITHQGKYRWRRLFFGLTQAPAFFQWVVEDVINPNGEEKIPCRIYLDDIIIFANTTEELLAQTKKAIGRLAAAGFMLNLRKSAIGVKDGTVLGHIWKSGGYFSPAPAKLKALLELPDKKLAAMKRPQLFGLLSYFRQYIPDFPLRTKPLRKLLSKPHLLWTQEHSQCVRETVERILGAVPMINFDPTSTLRLEVHIGPSGMAGVLLQRDPSKNRYLPVASHSRTWQDQEQHESKIQLELKAIQETLTKLQHYTAFAAELEISASKSTRAAVKASPRLHPKLQAQIVDIKCYQPKWVSDDSVLPPELAWDASDDWESYNEDEEDYSEELQKKLQTPVRQPKAARFSKGAHVHVQFDGGSKGNNTKRGACGIGYVIADVNGQELVRVGKYMGNNLTNNECETAALRDAMKHLVALRTKGGYAVSAPIRIFGDSQLTINFMTGVFKPKKRSIYNTINEVRQLVRDWQYPIAFRHVPREYNKVADDMVQRACTSSKVVEYRPHEVPKDAPPLEIEAVYSYLEAGASTYLHNLLEVPSTMLYHHNTQSSSGGGPASKGKAEVSQNSTAAAIWDDRLRGKPCTHCGTLEEEGTMYVCDRCERCYHNKCIITLGGSNPSAGPWYCPSCRGAIIMYGFRDITEDIGLLEYLFTHKLPQQEEEVQRILKLSQVYRAEGEALQVQLKQDGMPARWVEVPPLSMREQIVKDLHEGLGHCGRDKLVEALQISYWWPGLRATVTRLLKICPACQPQKLPKLPIEPPRLTNTSLHPGGGWSIDLAGPFPRDDEDNVYCIVAVDTLTKWVEVGYLKSKHAFRTSEWFFKEILGRWGRPEFIRTDNGSEWQAEFEEQIKQYGIKHLRITVGNSKSNGQVERIIRVIKEVIRKYAAQHPTAYWSDIVPHALILLRHTTTRAHGFSPYTMITGALPNLIPAITEEKIITEDPTEEEEENYTCYILKVAQQLRKLALERRYRGYTTLLKRFKQKEKIDHPETLTYLKEGDLVLKRAKASGKYLGKLDSKSSGPFRVIKVQGKYGQKIKIAYQGKDLKRKRGDQYIHASKLVRYHTQKEDENQVEDFQS